VRGEGRAGEAPSALQPPIMLPMPDA
jgi:hypothetical protein